jgi:glucokinase
MHINKIRQGQGGRVRFLVGDIGGTKTLLATFTKFLGELELEREERFLSAEYGGLEEILELFLKREKIDAACFAFAGPVDGGVGYATNLPWVVDEKKIEKRFSIPKVFLMNDLVLNAYGIRSLQSQEMYTLHVGVKAEPKANQALISAGTGLGECIIIEGTHPIHSEGGHCDFSPRDEKEIELFRYLQKRYGHVSYERVLSGPGLVNLYQFLIDSKIEKPSLYLEGKKDIATLITQYGVSKECLTCYHLLLWFSSLYGAEAGNLALKGMSLGGVFLGGGIAPSILSLLKEGSFMKGFIDKGRFAPILEKMTVKVILENKAARNGAAFFLKNKFFCK